MPWITQTATDGPAATTQGANGDLPAPAPAAAPAAPQVHFPRPKIAILRNNAETAHTPSYDLGALATVAEDRWDVRWFDDTSFGGMLGQPSPFGALVFGYNAISFSEDARTALSKNAPADPLVLLHQLRPSCYEFLQGRLALKLEQDARVDIDEARPPDERRPDDEILLRFPRTAGDGSGLVSAKAIRWFSFEPGSAWRVVLEARDGTRRLPVLVRTADVEQQRIVACSLLLEPRIPAHAALLENMLTYAALGWPEIAVVERHKKRDSFDGEAIARKLRVQGARTIRYRCSPDERSFERWPLRGMRRVVLAAEDEEKTLAGAEKWRAAGGVAVLVDGQEVTVKAGASDAEWVARQWATWYSGCAPERWQSSVFASREVLRMLEGLHGTDLRAWAAALEDTRPDLAERLRKQADHCRAIAEALAIGSEPSRYATAVAALLRRRVKHGNVEETISVTVAALDLDGLLRPGASAATTRAPIRRWVDHETGDPTLALTPYARWHVISWLRAEFATASLADRLDIARVLHDASLLDEALRKEDDFAGPPSAIEVSRLREAVLACHGVALRPLPDHVLRALERKSGVIADLGAGSLRCAEYIEPYARCRLVAPDHPLGQLAPKVAEAAFEGLAESCALAREDRLSDSNGHDMSVEGLALLRWLTLDPGAALQMRPQSRELPAKAISAVLGEVERARSAEQSARVDVPALGTAVLLLGAATLSMLVVALLAAMHKLDVTVTATDRIVGAIAFVTSVVVLSVFRWLVLRASSREHPERRDLAFAQVVLFVAVMLALVAGVWKLVSADWKPNPAVLAAAVGVVALILLVLRRFRLAPIWAVEVAAVFSDPGGLLKYVVAKDSKKPAN